MSTTMQLSDLMTAVRQRADMLPSGYTPSLTGASTFVTDPELIFLINQSYFKLYDKLISAYGSDYFVQSPYAITTDGTNYLFALPSDFYKLLGVDLKCGTRWTSLEPFSFADRNRYGTVTPAPRAGQSLQLWYAPKLTTLSSLTDTLDGISGWTEVVILDVAIQCMAKEESDVSVLAAELQTMNARLTDMAENRDIGHPATVVDVYASRPRMPMQYRLVGGQIWLKESGTLSMGFADTIGEPFGWE